MPLHYDKHTDDLDGVLKRRDVRALLLLNPIGFYHKGGPHGVNCEALQDFEKFVSQKFKTGTLTVKVTFLPLRPDQAEPALTRGMGEVITCWSGETRWLQPMPSRNRSPELQHSPCEVGRGYRQASISPTHKSPA